MMKIKISFDIKKIGNLRLQKKDFPYFNKSAARIGKDLFSPPDGCYTIFIPLQKQQEDV